jgi:hypothetical protein
MRRQALVPKNKGQPVHQPSPGSSARSLYVWIIHGFVRRKTIGSNQSLLTPDAPGSRAFSNRWLRINSQRFGSTGVVLVTSSAARNHATRGAAKLVPQTPSPSISPSKRRERPARLPVGIFKASGYVSSRKLVQRPWRSNPWEVRAHWRTALGRTQTNNILRVRRSLMWSRRGKVPLRRKLGGRDTGDRPPCVDAVES